MKKVLSILISVFIMTLTSASFADNPVVQTIFTADPAPMVYNNTLYLYVSHDEDNAGNTFVMKDWRCFSTADMVNWTDHGVILNTQSVSWSQGGAAYAGQCIARNGKFYWYFPTTCISDPGFAIGVAVADSPTGPFTDIGHPLIYPSMTTAATHGWSDIDPTVFIADDGQAYMYWGNNMCYWVKLNSDMISINGIPTNVPLTTEAFGRDYEEGPWFWGRNGHWYLAYCSGIPESIHYSMAQSPTGPWTYKGCLMAVQPESEGNQAGIVDYKGKSYFFGFNEALANSNNYKRSVCVKEFTYNADGTIPQIPTGFDSSGPNQIGTLNPYVRTEAETICWESGIETETCSEGGMNVGYIENGDYIKVKGVNFGSGAASFDARVSSATNGGNIEIRLDSPSGQLVGTLGVQGTGGWQNWVTKSTTISGATGVHDLYFVFTGGSGNLLNLNWWKFNPGTTSNYIQIRNRATNLNIDGMGHTGYGSDCGQWGNSGSNNQQWIIETAGDYVMIKNRATGLYLDGMGRSNIGSNCGQWGSSGSNNQQWTQESLGGGYYKFRNRATGLYLDGMGSTSNGSALGQWSDSSSYNQQWYITTP